MWKPSLTVIQTLLAVNLLFVVVHAEYDVNIDVYTQYMCNGQVPSEQSVSYGPRDEVVILANVTYSSWPIQSMLVHFEIIDPNNVTLSELIATTDDYGRATISFTIPWNDNSVYGCWKVVGTILFADKTFQDVLTFEVVIPGDINHDGIINMLDVQALIKAYGSFPGHTHWNHNADLNKDCKVDLMDVFRMMENYGKTYH